MPTIKPFWTKSAAQTLPPLERMASPKIGPKPLTEKDISWPSIDIESAPLNIASMKSLVKEPTNPTERK